jgi:hypothetical protein
MANRYEWAKKLGTPVSNNLVLKWDVEGDLFKLAFGNKLYDWENAN